MRLTHEELAAMPEKTKKHAGVVRMYLEHDFLTAYAMHTDLRVRENGPAAAIGAEHDWERHGELQLDFLISQGLRPVHRLLEVGCGTGRLARKVVPYLLADRYVGVDISEGALDAACELANAEGWASKLPRFLRDAPPLDERFDYAWAFSVFIHLPAELVMLTMWEVAQRLKHSGEFLFSYVPERADLRTGLKQFRHTQATIEQACAKAGLSFEPVPEWRGEQRIARARRL